MGYDEEYYQNQISKSDDKVAWQYGSMVALAGLSGQKDVRVLDAGCGAGPGLRYLDSRGYETFGTDFVRYPLSVAHQLVPEARLAQTDLRVPLPFSPASFHLILMSEVIEHIDDTRALLDECRRVLAEGGSLVLTTPNLWDIRKYWQGQRWSGYVDKTHRRLFSPRSLSDAMRAAGYQQVCVRSGFKPMFWISSRRLGFRFAVPWFPYLGNTLVGLGRKVCSDRLTEMA